MQKRFMTSLQPALRHNDFKDDYAFNYWYLKEINNPPLAWYLVTNQLHGSIQDHIA